MTRTTDATTACGVQAITVGRGRASSESVSLVTAHLPRRWPPGALSVGGGPVGDAIGAARGCCVDEVCAAPVGRWRGSADAFDWFVGGA